MAYERTKPHFDSFHEECGVFGVFSKTVRRVADDVYFGLYAIQHRGQEAAGIAIANDGKIAFHKDMGLVPEIFNEEILKNLPAGNIGVGHVRYSTCGKSNIINTQPIIFTGKCGRVAVAHNGNLINAKSLRDKLIREDVVFQTAMDTEVIAALINKYSTNSIEEGILKACEEIKGAFSILVMTADKLVAIRDANGFRPLCLGEIDGDYVFSSETCGLDAVNATFIKDIQPGEMVTADKNGINGRHLKKSKSATCIFEHIYFARPDSMIDGCSVYAARKESGVILANNYPVEADIVSGVPDSALVAARGYSEASGIKYSEAITKNRYVGRSFIQASQKQREASVRVKMNALKYNVNGKRVILIDDSIVRGTTGKKIIDMLKKAGAKEVHFRISSPIVKHPCYFGIDIQTHDQLIGAYKTEDEICKIIGADSLKYLSVEELVATVKHAKCNFCLGCFTGNYPMKIEDDQISKMQLE
jgi:amidophosphoribosyltransferase